MKPVVVCGIDFSGTSVASGLLHMAGIDMGDVEGEADVAASARPIRYRTFQDREFNRRVQPLACELEESMPIIPVEWLHKLMNCFMEYVEYRDQNATGQRWGVKCNGLLFLALYNGFLHDSVQWVTTYRPFGESIASCERKGLLTPLAEDLMQAQVMPCDWLRINPATIVVDYHHLMTCPQSAAYNLLRPFGLGHHAFAAHRFIDPKTKGIIPCHGSLQGQLSSEL